ncbi:flagellar assembly protein FliX [Stappia sp.]|uniref:flagellar assembly protein FliX n=1 Tax=Stappia sp. TaxID=1870903 RepID=UPI003A99FD16
MRISGYPPVNGVAGRNQKKRSESSGGTFELGSGGSASAAGAASSGSGIGGIQALLALQEVDDPLTGRRKAVARGHDLLDTLENVKADLLAGRVSPERLGRLMQMLERREASGDTQLEQVIDEIELRARVELAKLGHFGD